MKWICLTLAIPMLLGGCAKTERSIVAQLDADFATGQVVLTCKSSTSGTCYAIFLADGELLKAEAAAGATASVAGVNEGTRYCVDVAAPDVTKCHPKPLARGEQIVRHSTVKG